MMETSIQTPIPETSQDTPVVPVVSEAATSPEALSNKQLLAEARQTRDVLVGFRSAIEAGTYHGSKMFDIAKGLAFLEAIMNQNQAHIKRLQDVK
jgi:hypothetical protein